MKRLSRLLGMSFTAALIGCQSAEPFTQTVDSDLPCVRITDAKENARIKRLLPLLIEAGVPVDFARQQRCLLSATTSLTPYAQAAYIELAAQCNEPDVTHMMKRVQLEVERYRLAKQRVDILSVEFDRLPACDFNALALVATSLNILQPGRELRQMLARDADIYPRFYGTYPRERSLARITLEPFLWDAHSFVAANAPVEKNAETFGR